MPDTIAAPIDPALVEEAQQALRAVQIRARTHSQRPSTAYDRADLEAATGLTLPDLPSDWTVRDVQVFPARQGTGVEIALDAGGLGDLALFATQIASNATASEDVAPFSDGPTAYWHVDRTAYALSGSGDVGATREAALKLAARR